MLGANAPGDIQAIRVGNETSRIIKFGFNDSASSIRAKAACDRSADRQAVFVIDHSKQSIEQ